MKTLTDYTKQGTTKAMNDFGAFFAFSTEQFNEQKKENVIYVNMGSGLICPKENAPKLHEALSKNFDNGVKQDIAENGIDNIIKRELINHEAYYTGDLEDTAETLKCYNITIEQIRKIYFEELPNMDF